ncbi:DUF2946 family protein [Novosphingobium album (ex Hu et al. 2023)]|uniref:DUF2946 domain-containing protein n=1 Tax=Novosphingobium album (ex Hu et al. 2023) TaxID=2930093 RepID=A0ABT0AZ57_9SPHN|nr:DUF2946 family protein [Novosphingobium album (ex Hu et al. 2023)]MCJ2178055.1 hypothetical protein [Novosphingobium album (ex Hu et al. 2023)]
MHLIRSFLQRHFHVAAVILALALAMKAFVPAGYMIGSTAAKSFTVEICDGQGAPVLSKLTIPGKSSGVADEHTKAAKDCPFTALSMHALGGADDALLIAALAFILALGFAAAPQLRLARIGFLTPPLRGPPALS